MIRWQTHELNILKTQYPTVSLAKEMLPFLPGRTLNQIRCQAGHLGLRRLPGVFDQRPLQIPATSAAYIAGFVDGEGSITIKRHSRPNRKRAIELDPHVFIYNSNRAVLMWIKETISELPTSLRVRNENNANNPNGKEVLELKIGGVYRALRLLVTIHPYLIIKKRQSELLIEYCRGRVLYAPYTARELEIMTAIQSLNRRGKE